MSMRVYERHDDSYGAWFQAARILETVRSDFQEIVVFETAEHGRILHLDGLTMLTDDTHFVYHEHMAHIPAACAQSLSDVLIVGGGDGGVATELVKYDEVKSITVAELDPAVIEVSRRWFPEVAAGLDDPRVTIEVGDGAAFLAERPAAFDLVIVDSTDICDEAHAGAEAASPLATDAFYASLRAALRPGAVALQVLGNPIFYRAGMRALLPRLAALWPRFEVVSMPTPFYISGDWAAGLFAVDGVLEPRMFRPLAGRLDFVTPDVARGALARPAFLERMIAGED